MELYRETGRPEVTFPVIFERTGTGYSAYVPDLDGCVSAGSTLDETRTLIVEAIALHLEGMVDDGDALPEPSIAEMIDVPSLSST